jgi:hypothetical protein
LRLAQPSNRLARFASRRNVAVGYRWISRPDSPKRLLKMAFVHCGKDTLAYCLDMRRHTRQRLLDLMIVRIGRAPLAARLGVLLPVLDDWLAGRGPIPDEIIVPLIDLIEATDDRDRSA